ncbi:ABC transporter permease [Kribbella sp. NPDC058245]|uniref:ABC transporter permease n=1 Tax=Kribbella sp. NPDC058245 TaxID=3346399 RepID=UPI0036EB9338
MTAVAVLPAGRTHNLSRFSGVLVLGAVVVLLLLAPMFAPYPPNQTALGPSLQGPSWSHLFGIDEVGRDLFSRTLSGVRTSLAAASLAVGVALLIGVPLGVLSGYLRGFADGAITRAVGVLQTMPGLILAMAIVGATGRSLVHAMIAIGIVFVPRIYRVVRASALATGAQTYVEAARSMGSPGWRIMTGHVLPGILPAVLVQATVTMAVAVLSEASLSFVGLGVQPPSASLGTLIAESDDYLGRANHLAVLPGVAMVFVVLLFTAFATRLRRLLEGKR